MSLPLVAGAFLTQWAQLQHVLYCLSPVLRHMAGGTHYPSSDTARWAADFIDALIHSSTNVHGKTMADLSEGDHSTS